ncbi:MAG: hypothetical protein M1820_006524 [Bogoriella megaspora]|nr:MAG: hypothetical protein M1820_006524 [Bogoriella megaspora]
MSQVMQGSSFGFESAYMGLYAGETAFGCCPRYVVCVLTRHSTQQQAKSIVNSGYNCATNTFGRAPLCISTAFAGSITASSCSSGRIISTSIFDVGALTKISTQTTTAGIVEVHTVQTTGNFASITAPMVQLYQRPSDQLPLSVSATSSSPGSTPSKGSPFDPTLTPGKSLPTSAKAAIGIAVASVIILVIAAVRFLLFPRRRRKHIEISQPLEYNKPELDASNVAEDRIRFLRPRELPADIITEMPVEDKMELDATDGAGARFELAATAKTHEMSALSGVESGSTTARDKSWGSQNSPWQIYDKKQTDKPP